MPRNTALRGFPASPPIASTSCLSHRKLSADTAVPITHPAPHHQPRQATSATAPPAPIAHISFQMRATARSIQISSPVANSPSLVIARGALGRLFDQITHLGVGGLHGGMNAELLERFGGGRADGTDLAPAQLMERGVLESEFAGDAREVHHLDGGGEEHHVEGSRREAAYRSEERRVGKEGRC